MWYLVWIGGQTLRKDLAENMFLPPIIFFFLTVPRKTNDWSWPKIEEARSHEHECSLRSIEEDLNIMKERKKN